MAHEGWHVVQQLQGRVRRTGSIGGQPLNGDPYLEREAEMMGSRAMRFPPSPETARPSTLSQIETLPTPVVQRNGIIIVFEGTKYDITDEKQCAALLEELDDPFQPIEAFFTCAELLDSVQRNAKVAKTNVGEVTDLLAQLGMLALAECIDLGTPGPVDKILKIVHAWVPTKANDLGEAPWFGGAPVSPIDDLMTELFKEELEIERQKYLDIIHLDKKYLAALQGCSSALFDFKARSLSFVLVRRIKGM